MRPLVWTCGLLALASLVNCGTRGPSRADRERAYGFNNAGVAQLEQLNYAAGVDAFRQALTIDASLAIARINLSLALLYAQDFDAAGKEAGVAAAALPSSPQPSYALGLLARLQNRNAEARGHFEKVLALDASDAGTRVNLAQIALEESRYTDVVALLEPVVAAEPYHVTATYVLGLALSRAGRQEEGKRLLDGAQTLRGTGYGVTFGTGYLEQGRHAEAMASTGAEPDLVDRAPSAARFTATRLGDASNAASTAVSSDASPSPFGRRFSAGTLDAAGARALAAGLGGALALIDADGDGDLDVFTAGAGGQRLRRNDGGGWTEITSESGLASPPEDAVPVGALSADYDGDGFRDLFVLRFGASSLYRNDGRGHFADVTRAAGLPSYPDLPGAAAFADVDHDGDVDLVVAGLADVDATRARPVAGEWVFPHDFVPAPVRLLRNNANGTFTDISTQAGVARPGHAVAIVPADFDNRRDLDLLIVNRDAAPVMWLNQRDGSFRDATAAMGLDAVTAASGVSVADLNHDDRPDLFFAQPDGGTFALSAGRAGFALSAAPAAMRGAPVAHLVDYDGDGLQDLVAWTKAGLHVVRNLGDQWRDDTTAAVGDPGKAGASPSASPSAVALGDLDRDGHIDLVVGGAGSLWLWKNSGDPLNRSLSLELAGRVSNRVGVGAKVEFRAGSLRGRIDLASASPSVSPADVVFGLGPRAKADVVRVLWPSGIVQAEVAPAAAVFRVEELDRKPSSCPMLFTWNGERFEFVTDMLGGGEMGNWMGPAAFNTPDPVEYVRIRGDQLRERNGRLELRVTNELEEAVFLDEVRLLAVDHPRGVDVYPNEGLTVPAKPFRLFAVDQWQPPARVVDDHGHDVTARIARIDRTYPDDFTRLRFRGYAESHTLTFDLGASPHSSLVLMTGWTDYAFSSDSVAASQAGLSPVLPRLEVKTATGRWRALAVAVGMPVGRPQTTVLDLTGLLRPGERELRLTTNLRVYWDQVLVGRAAPAPSVQVVPAALDLVSATLRVRGFSAEVRPDGGDPVLYDYANVSAVSSWKALAGQYTREGDVAPLVVAVDDQFVITTSGDEIALAFDARRLAPLRPGWARTYLLRVDGFSKEMDINSASPHAVEPLPFHGMSRYPYSATERYPETSAHQQYRDTYNTRQIVRAVPTLSAIAPR